MGSIISNVDLPCDIIPALVRQPDHHPTTMIAVLNGGRAAQHQPVELLIGGQTGEGGQEAVCREGNAGKEGYTESVKEVLDVLVGQSDGIDLLYL